MHCGRIWHTRIVTHNMQMYHESQCHFQTDVIYIFTIKLLMIRLIIRFLKKQSPLHFLQRAKTFCEINLFKFIQKSPEYFNHVKWELGDA